MARTESETITRGQLAQLWEGVEPAVRAYLSAEIRSRHDADDVLQEVGKAIMQSIHRYDTSRPFANWAFGVARYQLLRYFRSRSMDRTTFGVELLDQIAEASQELLSKSSDRREALEKCLESLGDRQKQAVMWYYGDQLSQAEIADRLEISESAVGVMLHRVRLGLRGCIDRRIGEGAESA